METEIVKLGVNDFEEMLFVLNSVFNQDFKKILPKMCQPTEECMNKHLAIKRDNKIKALLGIYPLPTNIAGEKLMFSTVGNVATLKEEEGKGYMSLLLNEAMKELDSLDVDASRLCGKRSRYNRYGYELCGSIYYFKLIRDTDYGKSQDFVELVRLEKKDKVYLQKAMELHENGKFYVIRENTDVFYDTLVAWENIPYVALDKEGNFLGYMSVSADNLTIAEINAVDIGAYERIIREWLSSKSTEVEICVMPHCVNQIAILSKYCSQVRRVSPSHFLIRNWEKVIYATMKLQSAYAQIHDYEYCIGIKGFGNYMLESKNNIPRCFKTDVEALLTLSPLEASRELFGPCITGKVPIEIFPLPLSWNGQDRV